MGAPVYRPKSLLPGCVRAVLAGRKRQLRQPLDVQPPEGALVAGPDREGRLTWTYERRRYHSEGCPLGRPGDRLWVREPWLLPGEAGPSREAAPGRPLACYQADAEAEGAAWNRAAEMPRALSRLTLEIVEVRLEQIQDITPEDLAEEGGMWRTAGPAAPEEDRAGFAAWWTAVNAKRGTTWERNPWVWVIRFRVAAEEQAAQEARPSPP
jgi:hypothetical protein